MIQQELVFRIQQMMGFVPTQEQQQAMLMFSEFLTDRNAHVVMVMRGSAGTGKTTLAGAIVKTMASLQQKMILMAPTGRAAKVFALNAGHPAYTIHRCIYRQKTAADFSAFNLNHNLNQDTLFMVDEASMIANDGFADSSFGSGYLLDDLMQYVYDGRNCRLMFIGDTAQLPPIGAQESPALVAQVLSGYGMKVYETDLTEVLRQGSGSGILWNATQIRALIQHDELTQLPIIHFSGFADIKMVPGNELIEQLATSYQQCGMDDTIVITRSNKRANIYNQGIRNTVLDREDQLCTGDMLMVVKNKYFSDGGFIANGDHAEVQRVRHYRDFYGFHFADVTLSFPDYDHREMDFVVILDTLTSEAPALTREQQEQLYQGVMEDYADVPLKADRIKKLKNDAYYNALQVKFAYAVTCHKAQGGQWSDVYVDQGYMTDDMLSPDYIHWLYTAFTRATRHLYLVNWPKTQTAADVPEANNC